MSNSLASGAEGLLEPQTQHEKASDRVGPATEFDTGTQLHAGDFTAPGRVVVVLSNLLLWVASLGVVYMALATAYDVFMRYVFHAPTSWATETSTYALILTIFAGAAHTHLADKNVRVHVLIDRLSPGAARDLKLVCAWLAVVYVAVAGWQGILMVMTDYTHGARVFGLLLTPTWMPKTPIAVGLCALAAALLADIDRLLTGAARWRRILPYALGVAVVALLLAFGRTPPLLPGTRVDLGSVAVLAASLIGAFVTSGMRVGFSVLSIWAASIALFIGGQVFGVGALTGILFVAIMFFMALGVHVAFALAIVGMLSIYFMTPVPFPVTLPDRAWSGVNSFSLTAVPLKVLMAIILVKTGMTNELFSIMAKFLRRLPGGLAHAAIVGCAIFAALSGSSVATAATIGTVACPEMTDRHYSRRLTYGTVAAGGTLGILVPPSIAMIIYATNVGVPATKLFVAGIAPAALMMLTFMAVIVGWVLLKPDAAPPVSGSAVVQTRAGTVDALLVLGMILAVIATLYAGVATATETGAIGVMLALVLGAVRGRLSRPLLAECFRNAVSVTCFIFLIIVGANILTFGFDYLKISQQIMAAATEGHVNRWVAFAIVVLVYVVLGAFLDSISMLVLTLPVVFPVMTTLGFDPLWFGVVLMIMAEVGLIHPPMGMNLFVLQGIGRNVPMRDIVMGALPFLLAMFLMVLLLCVFPELALYLPSLSN
jgi:tripartite ATP-independent transporter DctM subunit